MSAKQFKVLACIHSVHTIATYIYICFIRTHHCKLRIIYICADIKCNYDTCRARRADFAIQKAHRWIGCIRKASTDARRLLKMFNVWHSLCFIYIIYLYIPITVSNSTQYPGSGWWKEDSQENCCFKSTMVFFFFFSKQFETYVIGKIGIVSEIAPFGFNYEYIFLLNSNLNNGR